MQRHVLCYGIKVLPMLELNTQRVGYYSPNAQRRSCKAKVGLKSTVPDIILTWHGNAQGETLVQQLAPQDSRLNFRASPWIEPLQFGIASSFMDLM